MDPELHCCSRAVDHGAQCADHSLPDAGEVPKIENVVEFCRGGEEGFARGHPKDSSDHDEPFH